MSNFDFGFSLRVDDNLKGSGASLSGLVQLPPCDREDDTLTLESSEESDIIEHDDMGRLIH